MFCDGAPCLDREKAFILAAMSEVSPLARVGGGPGRRAAFICPRGAEDGVIVFENDPSFAVRNEGGLGGDIESWDGCDMDRDLGAPSDRLSASEDCDPGFSRGRSGCELSSIFVTV